MDIIMNDEHIGSIAQLTAFLRGVDGAITFSSETKGSKNKQKMYEWIGKTLGKFRYFGLKKKERQAAIGCIKKAACLSRSRVKKLIARKKSKGALRVIAGGRNVFPTLYSTSDIARLIDTGNAHSRISGEAAKRIMQREYLLFGKNEYGRISHLSVLHLYRFRKNSRQYNSEVLRVEKTRAADRNIAIGKKPETFGKPGYLRVDTVHQGDKDKEKGVYRINLVDEVAQWEIVGCVRGISEEFPAPLLIELLDRLPFIILGFHSDNGGEYINECGEKLQKAKFKLFKNFTG